VMERVEAGRASGPQPDSGPGPGPRPGAVLARAAEALKVAFVVGYPVMVVLSVAYLGARTAALVLLAVLVAGRLRTLRQDLRKARALTALAASVAALLVAAAVLDDPRFLLAYPSLLNAVFLVQFGWSLRSGIPMAERFARMAVSDLSPAEIRYCRAVTLVWCAFFALNGGAATALALWAPRTAWAIYAGGVSYVLVGLVSAVEYVIRKARFGRFGPGIADRLLARLFPGAGASP
jgi:uncharacterized membrane protein